MIPVSSSNERVMMMMTPSGNLHIFYYFFTEFQPLTSEIMIAGMADYSDSDEDSKPVFSIGK